jgi:predicted nucleic acid-binding protein
VRLFLDACVIIYLIEGLAPFAAKVAAQLSALRQADPRAMVFVSDLSRLECRVLPARRSNTALLARYDDFFGAEDVECVHLTPAVVDLATAIRARSGLGTADALQAASCLALPDRARFITGDAGFRREPALDLVLIA